MQRSSTDASAAGQSTSGGGNGNDNNNQQSQQPTLNQTDITIQSADSTTVKANVGEQQQPGQQGGGVIAATASSMGQLKLKLDEFHLNDEHNNKNIDNVYSDNDNCNKNINSNSEKITQ